jgi:hypothetical protein
MLPTTLFAAAEHSGTTSARLVFYICGGVLAAWAVLVGVIGSTRPAFPRGEGAARGVMTVSVVLALATMVTAVNAGT